MSSYVPYNMRATNIQLNQFVSKAQSQFVIMIYSCCPGVVRNGSEKKVVQRILRLTSISQCEYGADGLDAAKQPK